MPESSGSRFDLGFPLAYAGVYFLVGLVLHLRLYPIGDFDLETDFYGDMVLAAEQLAHGHFSVQNYPYKGPFYSVPLILLHALVRNWYRSAVVLNLLAAGGSLFVGYRLLLALYNRTVAALGIVLASLAIDFFVHAHSATSDVLWLCLALASIYLVCVGGTPARRAAAGAMAALAYLTRMNGIILPVAAAASILLANPRAESWAARARGIALYLAAFLLLCSPWWLASLRETGHLFATKNVQNLVIGLYPGPRFATAPLDNLTSVGAVLRYDPGQCVRQSLANLPGHFWADMRHLVQFPVALLVLLGVAGVALGAASRAQWSLYVFALVYAALMAPFFHAPRFFFVLLFPYYGSGLAMLFTPALRLRLSELRLRLRIPRPRAGARLAAGRGARRWIAPLFLGAFGAAVVGVQVERIVRAETVRCKRRPLNVLTAARVLRDHARRTGGSRVMARKGHLALHAGLGYQPYPKAAASTLEDLLQFAQQNRVDYLAFGGPEFQLVPKLRFLGVLDSIPGLQGIYLAPGTRIFALTSRNSLPVIGPGMQRRFLEANVRASLAQHDAWYVSHAYNQLGMFLSQQGEGPDAEQAFRQAILAAEPGAAQDPLLERNASVARHNLAVYLASAGRPREVIPLLERNLQSYARSGSKTDVAWSRQVLGMAWGELGNREEALLQLRQAHELFLQTGDLVRADSVQTLIDSEMGGEGGGPAR